jgi:hypothetical protein
MARDSPPCLSLLLSLAVAEAVATVVAVEVRADTCPAFLGKILVAVLLL